MRPHQRPATGRWGGTVIHGGWGLCQACTRREQRARTTSPGPSRLPGRWVESANCASADPEVMFCPADAQVLRAARAVCAACPVRRECLEHALSTAEPDGVWGGLTPGERRARLDAAAGGRVVA
ncbi:MAG: WhiB family transcriptional regulator [Actinomyces sp.]|uniref:WhiB family transcriptional regulator n=1 Tax=Actinomyces sp. TaxID=29317 RepID=UPI0026DB9F97|nr:WhiB family transcriptional regulator [Actinomyces sp.]MDO4243511.1 WhiB family transcriptional regulator [Actinomyces sp.]